MSPGRRGSGQRWRVAHRGGGCRASAGELCTAERSLGAIARKPQGRFLGVPYDLSRTTRKDARKGLWDPDDRRVSTAKNYGSGYTINLCGISPASQPSLMAGAGRALSARDRHRATPTARPPPHAEPNRWGFPHQRGRGCAACQTPDRPSDFGGRRTAVCGPMETTPSPTAASGGPHRSGVLARFVHAAARSAARRPKTTVALWLALIVACVVLGSSAGMRTLSNAGSGTGESARADARLTASGLQGPATENVLVRSSSPAAHRTRGGRARGRRAPPARR